jgi:hypothetical protein
MKTIKKLILTAILTMPAITNAEIFTVEEISSVTKSDFKKILNKINALHKELKILKQKETIEFQDLCKLLENMTSEEKFLKEIMRAANALDDAMSWEVFLKIEDEMRSQSRNGLLTPYEDQQLNL